MDGISPPAVVRCLGSAVGRRPGAPPATESPAVEAPMPVEVAGLPTLPPPVLSVLLPAAAAVERGMGCGVPASLVCSSCICDAPA